MAALVETAMKKHGGEDKGWPAAKVRETFLDFFRKEAHTFGMISSHGKS